MEKINFTIIKLKNLSVGYLADEVTEVRMEDGKCCGDWSD